MLLKASVHGNEKKNFLFRFSSSWQGGRGDLAPTFGFFIFFMVCLDLECREKTV